MVPKRHPADDRRDTAYRNWREIDTNDYLRRRASPNAVLLNNIHVIIMEPQRRRVCTITGEEGPTFPVLTITDKAALETTEPWTIVEFAFWFST
jgi:hypothetical protein